MRHLILGAALLPTALACAHAPTVRDSDEGATRPYRLGRGDVIEVSVYREPDLSRTLPIRPDGRISLPVAGELVAAGRTADELRQEVAARLERFIRDPTVVSVIVREVDSARFYVVGEVEKPGAYPLRSEVSVLQALAVAGGLGEFSARDQVTLLRGKDGRRIDLALKDLEAGRDRLHLRAGDTLVVR